MADVAGPAAPPRLLRDEGAPVFAEPWQAHAFALAVKLSEEGHFTWNEWASALADTLQAAADRGEPDDGSRYYDYWLATLERLVLAKGLTDQATLVARKEAWVEFRSLSVDASSPSLLRFRCLAARLDVTCHGPADGKVLAAESASTDAPGPIVRL